MNIPEWGKKVGDEIKAVFPASVMSVIAEPNHINHVEKALQLLSTSETMGKCDDVLAWCRREGMEADDLAHVTDAATARKSELTLPY